jgi:hypothetical protein
MFTLGLEELCSGDLECPLKITVFDHEESGKHRKIGGFETTVHNLIDRVAIKGNADRERGFKIFKEDVETHNRSLDDARNRGLVVVLKAELQLD